MKLRLNGRRLTSTALLTAVAAVLLSVTAVPAHAASSSPKQISLVVMPHPDDEMEAWSMIEDSSDNYKVFAYMTRGEETGYCEPWVFNGEGYQPQYQELTPTFGATAPGRWTSQCAEARIASTIGFLNQMAASDSSLPAGFSTTSYREITSLPSPATPNKRIDNVGTYTGGYANWVRLYPSTNGKGAILFFNLGDADLTTNETIWAVDSILKNKTALSLPNLPVYNAIGPFYNSAYGNCNVYPHADHHAVHAALFSHDFKLTGYQAAATCASDSDAVRTQNVGASFDRAFSVTSSNVRTGWMQRYYGWLDGHAAGWPAVASTTSQVNPAVDLRQSPFMRRQSFWQRY